MENFVITITLLITGMLLRRLPAFPDETGKVLNLFVIYISLPALVLLKIPELSFSTDLLILGYMPWGLLIFSAALILLLSIMFNWDRETTGALLLIIPLGNTSFLGVPMVKAFFGDHAIPYALLYDQLGSFLALATYGSLILAVYGSGENRVSTITVLNKVMKFPPFIALIFAITLRNVHYSQMVTDLLKIMASTLIPLVMVAVGYQLRIELEKRVLIQMGAGLMIKLIVAPLSALLLCRLLGMKGEIVHVALFEAGMPPMVSAGALAMLAGLSPALTAALVGIGIVVSFATLPALYHILIW